MGSESKEAFDEIFYCHPVGPCRDTYKKQFVCSRHQEFVCGTCCMDFALLNELRYDNEYLVLSSSPTKRIERIQRVVDFYYMNPRAEFQRDPSRRSSPRLPLLLSYFSGNDGVSISKVIELAGYLSYVCRSDIDAQQRICTTLDTVLLEDLQQAEAKKQTSQHHSAMNSPDDSSEEGIPAPSSETKVEKRHVQQTSKNRDDPPGRVSSKKAEDMAENVLSAEIQNLVEQYSGEFNQCKVMLKQKDVKSFGIFFRDFKSLAVSDDEKSWTQFLRKHAKTGSVPADIDPEDWSTSRLVRFLDQQGLSLSPSPSRVTLAEVARKMLDFSSSCKTILYHYSIVKGDDRKEKTLGSRDSNCESSVPKVIATAKKSKTGKKKKSIPGFKMGKLNLRVEPQIPHDFRLSSVQSWDVLGKFVKCHPFFSRERLVYTKAFPLDNEFLRVLDLLELVADTYDRTQESHPPQDFLIVFTSKDEEGKEVFLAMRCLGASNTGSSSIPKPILQLEYLAAQHDPSSIEYKCLSNGIKPGITRFINETCEKKDMDLLFLLLETNRTQLHKDDVSQNFSAALSPNWKFSVVLVADNSVRGTIPLCARCGKSASMICSACEEVSYCSRDCQLASWSTHYRVCKKCQPTEETN